MQCSHIHLPGKVIKILNVANIDVLLDQVTSEDDLPFWAKLWPAARGLAVHLWQDKGLCGIKALELGAGTGLGGIVAALRGAHVIQTDFIPDALLFCQVNAALNDVSNISYELADWRDFSIEGKYPLIFGSDILYEKELHRCLVKIMDDKLAPGGRILIADPGRKTVMNFLMLAEATGFSWEVEEVIIAQIQGAKAQIKEAGTTPRTITIDILELSRA